MSEGLKTMCECGCVRAGQVSEVKLEVNSFIGGTKSQGTQSAICFLNAHTYGTSYFNLIFYNNFNMDSYCFWRDAKPFNAAKACS